MDKTKAKTTDTKIKRKSTWPSLVEKKQAEREVQLAFQRDRMAWFERDEHKPIRNCTCSCGNTFSIHARDLACIAFKEVKDKEGRVVLEKGKPKKEPVTITRRLAKTACPKCLSNWIKSFT